MGKPSRDKGYRGEHEAKSIAEAAGRSVKRAWMSGMFEQDGADLEIDFHRVSVKRRGNGLKWAYDELARMNDIERRADGKPYILFRSDNQKWLKIEEWQP